MTASSTNHLRPRRHVIVLGAGMIGLLTAILLADDGHDVTVIERDPAPPPPTAGEQWEAWARRGVTQFRLPHALHPRWRTLVRDAAPRVLDELIAAGGLSYSLIDELPARVTGGRRPGDERFDLLTARRPIVEAALARTAATTPGITVRRGVAVAGPVLGPQSTSVAHVAGVRTTTGETILADAVVDAMGRRSPLTGWLRDLGLDPIEHIDDVGYAYYTRDFASFDGTHPVFVGPVLQTYGSHSILTVRSDRGTWSIALITSSRDRLLRRAADNEIWTSVIEQHPAARHWLDGQPLGDVVSLTGLEDRRRSLVVDGRPVVTGVFTVGDAWACTNPSIGRGITIGTMHAIALRDFLRTGGTADPRDEAVAWAATTDATVGPWFDETNAFDRHRLAEIDAHVRGVEHVTDDPSWLLGQALAGASMRDPDLFRDRLDIITMHRRGAEVFARPGVADRVLALAGPALLPGPTRAELVDIVTRTPAGASAR